VVALSLDTARNIALVLVAVLVVLAVVSAWLLKTVAQKLAVVAILGLLAVLAWSQRTALDDCADRVAASVAADAPTDTTCTFFGQDVTVPARPA
jgi:hypothetical protein